MLIPFLGFGQWVKIFDGTDIDYGFGVVQVADSGFVLAGYTKSYSMSYHHDIFVMKTNKHGDSLWHKTYGGICAEGARNIIKTSDGGFAIIGEKDCPNNSTDPSAYLLKLDANGDSLWGKYLHQSYGYGYSIQQTNDDGYIIATSYYDYGLLIRTNSLGDTLWTKMYGDSLYTSFEEVKLTNDGGYIVVGENSTTSSNSDDHAFVLKTDSLGNVEWYKIHGGVLHTEGRDILQLPTDDFILAGQQAVSLGSQYPVSFLLKTDANGDTLWKKTYPYSNFSWNVVQTTDGGFLLGTEGTDADGWYSVLMIKTDNIGDTLWTSSIYLNAMMYGSVKETFDGGYIIIASTNDDVCLIKLNASGAIISSTKDLVLENTNRKLIRISDVLGREANPKSNMPLFYIYDNGTVEKRIIIE